MNIDKDCAVAAQRHASQLVKAYGYTGGNVLLTGDQLRELIERAYSGDGLSMEQFKEMQALKAEIAELKAERDQYKDVYEAAMSAFEPIEGLSNCMRYDKLVELKEACERARA